MFIIITYKMLYCLIYLTGNSSPVKLNFNRKQSNEAIWSYSICTELLVSVFSGFLFLTFSSCWASHNLCNTKTKTKTSYCVWQVSRFLKQNHAPSFLLLRSDCSLDWFWTGSGLLIMQNKPWLHLQRKQHMSLILHVTEALDIKLCEHGVAAFIIG